jgi:predicted phage gp36 major capsid-like protein
MGFSGVTRDSHMPEASGRVEILEAENRRLKLDLDDVRAENRRLKTAVERMHDEILTLSRTIESLSRTNASMYRLKASSERQLQAIYASSSWRLTEPLRRIAGKGSPTTRRYLRRAAKAAWWAMTPWRIPDRIRLIRERSAASGKAPFARR